MRKHYYLIMCLICSLIFVAACTDNHDDTPVEAKNEVKEIKTSGSLNKINSLLKEV
ncbi:hypothetical protein LG296_02375 [Ureibacillus chungkukjangi]|uniref:hypothetical protein n=1 Tax=Ureibacillus chungkukjangi TaxID=1202712 RepID=UPI002041B844|nr:hypothetical protein [Ureibacillus chungkukjangi]MCM3389190.1 hypothetical protein [Ureibacillus chungkukjangi]